MQIEIVRHHRGAEDADGDVEHGWVEQDLRRGQEKAAHRGAGVWVGEEDLDDEQCQDGADQGDDQRLELAEAPALEHEQEKAIEAGDADAPEQWDVEEQLEGDGRTDDLGQVAGGDADLGEGPVNKGEAAAEALMAELGEVAVGGDAEFER